jgi:NADP-dependent 3-hydroxy acid dehydrogenase YdfG
MKDKKNLKHIRGKYYNYEVGSVIIITGASSGLGK